LQRNTNAAKEIEAAMLTREDIQSFIDRLEGGTVEATEVEPGLWRVRSQTGAEAVVHYAPPVVLLRMRVMEPPAGDDKRSGLFRQLLEFNAKDLVHGSYGLEGEQVVLTDVLELENLDYAEFEASFDSMTLALASHLSALAPYRER
jgi:CesT_Tir_1